MKRLPKKLVILGRTFTVDVVPYDHDKLDGCQGVVYQEQHKIYIKKGMAPAQQWEVLLHELGHAVCNLLLMGVDRLDVREEPYNTYMSGLFSALMENNLLGIK